VSGEERMLTNSSAMLSINYLAARRKKRKIIISCEIIVIPFVTVCN
jgi:hypothetical protein